jgi:hypothetical protein
VPARVPAACAGSGGAGAGLLLRAGSACGPFPFSARPAPLQGRCRGAPSCHAPRICGRRLCCRLALDLDLARSSTGVLLQPAAASPWLPIAQPYPQMLDYPGRPALVTLGNNTAAPAPALLSYIPPVQTLPCDLTIGPGPAAWPGDGSPAHAPLFCSGAARAPPAPPPLLSTGQGRAPLHSVGPPGPFHQAPSPSGPVPTWEEDLALDAPQAALASEDVLLLAEVLQLPGSFREGRRAPAAAGWGGGGGRGVALVAWGFLRLKSLGVAGLGPDPKRLRLQLFQYLPRPGRRACAALWGRRGGACIAGLWQAPCVAAGGCVRALPRLAVPGTCHPCAFLVEVWPLQRAANLAPAAPFPLCSSTRAAAALASPAPFPDTPAKAAFLSWRATLGMPAGFAAAGPAAAGALPVVGAVQAVPEGRSAAGARPAAAKLPAVLELSLSAAPRPEGLVVVTDAALGVRPALPAGYGSGYEVGERAGGSGGRVAPRMGRGTDRREQAILMSQAPILCKTKFARRPPAAVLTAAAPPLLLRCTRRRGARQRGRHHRGRRLARRARRTRGAGGAESRVRAAPALHSGRGAAQHDLRARAQRRRRHGVPGILKGWPLAGGRGRRCGGRVQGGLAGQTGEGQGPPRGGARANAPAEGPAALPRSAVVGDGRGEQRARRLAPAGRPCGEVEGRGRLCMQV